MVLANAIYFKGSWVLPFEKNRTRDEPFHLEAGGKVNAPLMRRKAEISYMRGEGFQAVDLGYRGGDLSMLILLPDRVDGLRELEEKISPRVLSDYVAAMQAHEVDCLIPRFKFTLGAINLREPLAKLGLSLPFDRTAADFSGINGLRPPDFDALYVSAVFQKAFVEVNEEGTEAAAATGAVLGLAMAPAPRQAVEFRADHPFVFAIRDRKSGEILFIGRVVDPTREG